jgi:hypothetical protein
MLGKLFLSGSDNPHFIIENQASRRGRSLVDRQHIPAHFSLPKTVLARSVNK